MHPEFVGQLTYEQYAAKVWVNTTTSILSIIGALVVIHLARRKWNEMYHRILCLLGISDLLATISYLLFPFVKIANEDWPWTVGNDSSCTVGAVLLISFPYISQVFNLYLAVYFYFSVVCNGTDTRFRRTIEKPFLIICVLLIPIAEVASALSLGVVNPHPINQTCYMGPPRQTCSDDDNACWDHFQQIVARVNLMSAVSLFKNFTVALASFLFTLRVCAFVQQNLRRSKRRSLNPDSVEQKQRQAMIQLVLFTSVYINSIIWTAISFIWVVVDRDYVLQSQGDPPLYYTLLMSNIFLPIQGFLNCFIYVRPQWATWRRAHPTMPWYNRLVRVVRGDAVPPLAPSTDTEPLPAVPDVAPAAAASSPQPRPATQRRCSEYFVPVINEVLEQHDDDEGGDDEGDDEEQQIQQHRRRFSSMQQLWTSTRRSSAMVDDRHLHNDATQTSTTTNDQHGDDDVEYVMGTAMAAVSSNSNASIGASTEVYSINNEDAPRLDDDGDINDMDRQISDDEPAPLEKEEDTLSP